MQFEPGGGAGEDVPKKYVMVYWMNRTPALGPHPSLYGQGYSYQMVPQSRFNDENVCSICKRVHTEEERDQVLGVLRDIFNKNEGLLDIYEFSVTYPNSYEETTIEVGTLSICDTEDV